MNPGYKSYPHGRAVDTVIANTPGLAEPSAAWLRSVAHVADVALLELGQELENLDLEAFAAQLGYTPSPYNNKVDRLVERLTSARSQLRTAAKVANVKLVLGEPA